MFVEPDINSPLDTKIRLEKVPDDEMVKGIFFGTAIDEVKKQTGKELGRGKYSLLASYKVSELIQILDEASTLVYPGKTPRMALRLLGQQVIPKLKSQPAGSFLFSLIGSDVAKGFSMVSRFYSLLSQTQAQALDVTPNSAIFSVKGAWTFPTCYHVGFMEGYIKIFGKEPHVTVQEHSLCDVDIKCEWK